MSRASLLVRIPNWLGDLVLSLPVVESAAAASERLTLVGPEAFRALLAPRFPGAQYIAASRARRWEGVDAIRHVRPGAALLLTESLSSALLVWMAGVPERIGYAAEGRAPLLTRRVARTAPARTASRASEYRELALAAGLPEPAPTPRLEALPAEATLARELLAAVGVSSAYLAIAPGASYGPAKQWDPERFVASSAGVAHRSGLAVVVVGGAEDRAAAAAVADGLRRAGVPAFDLAGKTRLPELVGVLAGAAAVASNDSGAMHVAAALRRPTMAVFGSTSPVWTSASALGVVNLYAAYPCSPCYRRTCPIGYRCLKAIAPEAAGAALGELLRSAEHA